MFNRAQDQSGVGCPTAVSFGSHIQTKASFSVLEVIAHRFGFLANRLWQERRFFLGQEKMVRI
jgi:hypothetical protein